jgi:hypothetical protein
VSAVPPVVLFVLGAAVGSYGTVIGAGGGFLLVPLLLLLYPADPVTTLAGLSLAVVGLNALSGSLAYAWQGRIDFPLGLRLAAASVPGTAAGAVLTRFVPGASSRSPSVWSSCCWRPCSSGDRRRRSRRPGPRGRRRARRHRRPAGSPWAWR